MKINRNSSLEEESISQFIEIGSSEKILSVNNLDYITVITLFDILIQNEIKKKGIITTLFDEFNIMNKILYEK